MMRSLLTAVAVLALTVPALADAMGGASPSPKPHHMMGHMSGHMGAHATPSPKPHAMGAMHDSMHGGTMAHPSPAATT